MGKHSKILIIALICSILILILVLFFTDNLIIRVLLYGPIIIVGISFLFYYMEAYDLDYKTGTLLKVISGIILALLVLNAIFMITLNEMVHISLLIVSGSLIVSNIIIIAVEYD